MSCFFFKQKSAYELRISDWSSDVCASDLISSPHIGPGRYAVMKWLMAQMGQIGPMFGQHNHFLTMSADANPYSSARYREQARRLYAALDLQLATNDWLGGGDYSIADIATYPWASYCERHGRSEEHTSELQSLMRISYAVFCLKKNTTITHYVH